MRSLRRFSDLVKQYLDKEAIHLTPARTSPSGSVGVTEEQAVQAPNRVEVWSARQRPKTDAFKGPRFTQIDLGLQPAPLAAIELIKEDPVRTVHARLASCSGDGPLGHPKVFINLVQSRQVVQPHACRTATR